MWPFSCHVLTCKRLRPHESYNTDVILLGHSMGGILGAEVAIMPANPPSNQHPFQHKILGTVNFDTPFLGMHPGIVFAGIGSLFRSAPEPPRPSQHASQADGEPGQPLAPNTSASQSLLSLPERSQSTCAEHPDGAPSASTHASLAHLGVAPTPSPLLSPTTDPNYNPQFPNDAPVPRRQGWEKALNFLMKHSGDMRTATKTYVTSHFEFGGALADLNGLKNRYTILRLLEDGKDINGKSTRKVRFVNYYTASTGRPPKVKTIAPESDTNQIAAAKEERALEDGLTSPEGRISTGKAEEQVLSTISQTSPEHSIHESLEEVSHNPVSSAQIERTLLDDEDLYADGLGHEQVTVMRNVEPEAETESEADAEPEHKVIAETLPMPLPTSTNGISSSVSLSGIISTSSLPPLGPIPQPPADINLDSITDKDERKLAVKEYSRQMQAYQRAMKDREKAVKERQKLLEKREKAAEKDRLKQLKQQEKDKARAKKDSIAKATANEPAQLETMVLSERPNPEKAEKSSKPTASEKPIKEPKPVKEKPKKDRKFCMLPPKNSQGQDDKCWPRVFMEGVDEVGAHCGLFFADRPHYEGLVYNVGNRIKEWVMEARALHEERLLATQDFGRWREKR